MYLEAHSCLGEEWNHALRPHLSASLTLGALSREERQKGISYHRAGYLEISMFCLGGDSEGAAVFVLNLSWEWMSVYWKLYQCSLYWNSWSSLLSFSAHPWHHDWIFVMWHTSRIRADVQAFAFSLVATSISQCWEGGALWGQRAPRRDTWVEMDCPGHCKRSLVGQSRQSRALCSAALLPGLSGLLWWPLGGWLLSNNPASLHGLKQMNSQILRKDMQSHTYCIKSRGKWE